MKRKIFTGILLLFLCVAAFWIPTYAEGSKVVKVGVYEMQGYHEFDSEGNVSGYEVDYLNKISEVTGWTYEYVKLDNWNDGMEKLLSGEIDLLSPSEMVESRLQQFGYSSYSIGKVYGALVTLDGREDIVYEDFSLFNELTIGVEKGTSYETAFYKYEDANEFAGNIVEYNSYDELKAALEEGKVDAIVHNIMRTESDMKVIGKFNSASYYFLFRKDDVALEKQLNEALDQIGIDAPDFQDELQDEYFPQINEEPISKSEMEFVENCPIIKIGITSNQAPLVSKDLKTGELQGITIDILKKIQEISGLQFEYYELQGDTIDYEKLRQEGVQIVAGVRDSKYIRGASGLITSVPYISSEDVIICKEGFTYGDSSTSQTLAVNSESNVLVALLAEKYPGFEVVQFDSEEACLDAVNNGDASAALMNQYLADLWLSHFKYSKLQIIPGEGIANNMCLSIIEYQSGAGEEDTLLTDSRLISVINKSIKRISGNEMTGIITNHTVGTAYEVTTADIWLRYRTSIIVVAVAVIILLIALIAYIRQKLNFVKNLETKNDQLKSAIEQAQHANKAKSVFLANMSHEIRTPMNAIIGITSLARNKVNDPKKTMENLDKIEISSKMLLNIINDVLDMSAIESSKIKIGSNPFDFKQVMNNLTTIYYPLCKQKGIEFELVLDGLTEEVLIGDQLRVNQILNNLLSNAVKFTDAGGTIKVTIQQAKVDGDDVYIKLAVSDTGCGMTEDMLKRLFKPFEQEDVTTALDHGGSGLGMAITKNLIGLMEGSIDVTSKKGEGTTFTVSIPFKRAQQEEKVNPDEVKKIRALVVDDDKETIEYVSEVLSRMEVDHELAYSGADALEKIKEAKDKNRPYDVCFIDFKMPQMDGVELTKKIREMYDQDSLIVIVSAYDLNEVEDQCTEAGANMYLPKPLFQSTIFNVLMNLRGGNFVTKSDGSVNYDFKGRQILLADDTAFNIEIAQELLEMVNLKVECASNGKEAFEKFTASAPGTFEMILMDVQMPVMDGHEATKAIRASSHPEAKTVPIIAMTANAFTEDINASLAAGMNDHLTKPIDANVMYKTIARYLK